MEIVSIIVLIVISLATGIILRVIIRNRPKAELVIWGILMAAMLFFFIYGLILVINQETPLFTKKHYANEFSVISSIIFLGLGIYYFANRKGRLLEKNKKEKTLKKKT